MQAKGSAWARVYDDLLRHQADLSFDLEQGFFQHCQQWIDANIVLDFGSGNGYYASLLTKAFPAKTILCVDHNSDLVQISKEAPDTRSLDAICGAFTDVPADRKFDFIYSRHVLSYLNDADRNHFIEWASSATQPQAAFLTIDADDEAFFCRPRLPFLEDGNEKFKKDLKTKGGDRDLQHTLAAQFAKNGFVLSYSRPLLVHSHIAQRKYLMSMFMRSVAEIDHGWPLPEGVRQEIDAWTTSRTSYLQYGLFGSIFVKA